MAKLPMTVDEQFCEIEINPQIPLLSAIRNFMGLTGAKFGYVIAPYGVTTSC